MDQCIKCNPTGFSKSKIGLDKYHQNLLIGLVQSIGLVPIKTVELCGGRKSNQQGTKLTFLARSHLAPKFSKVVKKAKKLGAIKKKIVEKTHQRQMEGFS